MILNKQYKHLVLMGDPHYGRFNNAYEHLTNNLDYTTGEFIPVVEQYVRTHGRDGVAVVVMGDLYDNEQLISGYVQSKLIKLFQRIAAICDVIILVGNHDLYKANSLEDNNVIPLSLIPGITLVTDDPVYVLCNGEHMLGFISWQKDYTKFNALISDANSHNVQHLFIHNSIYGFEYEGIKVPLDNHPKIEDFKSFKTVSAGHIHKFQQVGNIRYVGSMLHLRTIEYKNDVVGISVLSVGTTHYDFYENTTAPRYVRYYLEELLNMTRQEAKDKLRNNYVTIITKRYLGTNVNTSAILQELQEDSTPVYRTITFKEQYGEAQVSTTASAPVLDPVDDSIDITDLYSSFISSVDRITVPKCSLELTPTIKADFINKFNSAYAEASTLDTNED